METLTLKLPEALDARLQEFARRLSVTKSEVVRRAIEEYLARVSRPAKGSFLSLASDLAGSLSGPPDLSTGPSHMEGYGE
jgi:hypothetical protein